MARRTMAIMKNVNKETKLGANQREIDKVDFF